MQFRQKIVIHKKQKQIKAIVKDFASEIKQIGSVLFLNLTPMELLILEYSLLEDYEGSFKLLPA